MLGRSIAVGMLAGGPIVGNWGEPSRVFRIKLGKMGVEALIVLCMSDCQP